jgi:hypothetical protein
MGAVDGLPSCLSYSTFCCSIAAMLSEVPHSACHDAIASRTHVLAEEEPFSYAI